MCCTSVNVCLAMLENVKNNFKRTEVEQHAMERARERATLESRMMDHVNDRKLRNSLEWNWCVDMKTQDV